MKNRRDEILAKFNIRRDVDTLKEALVLLGEIREDDEEAHAFEDDMRNAVLVAISEGAANPAGLAGLALISSTIQFSRWCA